MHPMEQFLKNHLSGRIKWAVTFLLFLMTTKGHSKVKVFVYSWMGQTPFCLNFLTKCSSILFFSFFFFCTHLFCHSAFDCFTINSLNMPSDILILSYWLYTRNARDACASSNRIVTYADITMSQVPLKGGPGVTKKEQVSLACLSM